MQICKEPQSSYLLEFAVECCVLAALYSGGYSSKAVLLLSTVDLFGECI